MFFFKYKTLDQKLRFLAHLTMCNCSTLKYEDAYGKVFKKYNFFFQLTLAFSNEIDLEDSGRLLTNVVCRI